MHLHAAAFAILTVSLLVLAGCEGGGTDVVDPGDDGLTCSISTSLLIEGCRGGRDCIPALSEPQRTTAGSQDAAYLRDEDRIIGLVAGGEALAIPHNILWWHEIANLDLGGQRVAVTYCPLTGSSLAFDRAIVGGAEFGVSGLLFQNNLTMYDRRNPASLWPQMNREAGCGEATGTALPMVAIVEMTWQRWRELHPETAVLSAQTGIYSADRYRVYPYAQYDYEEEDNPFVLFDIPIDARRPPKERVLGLPSGDAGIAFPFGTLADRAGADGVAIVEDTLDGDPYVVLWDTRAQGAMAFRPRTTDGQAVTLGVEDSGVIVDLETGSAWSVDGRARSGPLAGARLDAIPEAYVAFWFAWAAFHPDTALWPGA